jgi:putative transposase
MINRKHDLSILRQCIALRVHRTTIYREPKPVKLENLDLIKVIDTIHLDEPAWGVRKVRQYLNESGVPVGRRHCNTIFRKLGIHCIYRKPRTTIRPIGHKIYLYLLRLLYLLSCDM